MTTTHPKAEPMQGLADTWRVTSDKQGWSASHDGLGNSCYQAIEDENGTVVALVVARGDHYDDVDPAPITARILAAVNTGRSQSAGQDAGKVPAEPDWSKSETLPSEIWKMPMYSQADRLRMADGAVSFRDKVIANLRARLAAPSGSEGADQLEEMRARKDAAYLERNQVVAALASAFPSGVARTAIDGWSPDWHGCVYIDLPTGQASWHFHDSHAHLFAHLPVYAGAWDGHTTEQKYARLAALRSTPAPEGQGVADTHQSDQEQFEEWAKTHPLLALHRPHGTYFLAHTHYAWLAWQQRGATIAALREVLQFYADSNHFTMHDQDAWETVSGEPPNFYEDESNTATVEDGSVARAALAASQPPVREAVAPAGEPLSEEALHETMWTDLRAGKSDPFEWNGDTHLAHRFAAQFYTQGFRKAEAVHGILPHTEGEAK